MHFRSAFFWFCNDERNKVKALNPEYGVGDIAKELGRKWADVEPEVKQKYELMAEKDKARYERVSYYCYFLLLGVKERKSINLMSFDFIVGNDRVQDMWENCYVCPLYASTTTSGAKSCFTSSGCSTTGGPASSSAS